MVPILARRYQESSSDLIREDIESYMSQYPCSECGGARLKPASLSVLVGGINIARFTAMSVEKALVFIKNLQLTEKERQIARLVLKEIEERLTFLQNVGLNYLTLDRSAGTLSGGEAQRIRLATQIGSSLTGVLYILDEPSIGLHQRDNALLIQTLTNLRDLGNTVIVVEHDEDTIRSADYIVDIGPGAGAWGGQVVATGTEEEIKKVPESITGQYLSGEKKIPVPQTRRVSNGKWLEVKGARANNLRNIDVRFPLGVFICVTGVSGSGKSTLVNEILYRRLSMELHRSHMKPKEHDALLGLEHLDKVINVDQSLSGVHRVQIRPHIQVCLIISVNYSRTAGARARVINRAASVLTLKAAGVKPVAVTAFAHEMHFLPDVYVPCEVCRGKRYNRETLEIRYKGKISPISSI